MNDVLTRTACDFEDDTRHRQNIAKDVENEIAITDCRGRVLAVIAHVPRTINLAWGALRAFVVEVSRESVRGVYDTASLSPHYRNHAIPRDVTKTPTLIDLASPCNEYKFG
jgi:ABC-type Fe3+-hydroxamate transport system substrate-binding protein